MITPEEMRKMAEDLNATDAGRDFALADKLERASAMLRSIAAEREAAEELSRMLQELPDPRMQFHKREARKPMRVDELVGVDCMEGEL